MAEIATQDQFVEDNNGIRRLVRGGLPVPIGLFPPGSVKVNTVPTKSLAEVVVDAKASEPSGTALAPDAGISHEHAQTVQADAREQGTSSGSKSRSKSQAQG